MNVLLDGGQHKCYPGSKEIIQIGNMVLCVKPPFKSSKKIFFLYFLKVTSEESFTLRRRIKSNIDGFRVKFFSFSNLTVRIEIMVSTCQGEKAGDTAEKDSGDLHRACAAPRASLRGWEGTSNCPLSVLILPSFSKPEKGSEGSYDPQEADEGTRLPVLHDS